LWFTTNIVFHVEGSGTDSVIDPGQLKEEVGFGKEGNFSLCQEIIFLREFRYIPEISGICSTFNQVRRPFSSVLRGRDRIRLLGKPPAE
jgi:hypothetical protein